MDYASVKYLHMSCAVVSISLFTLRGVLQLQSKPWRRWALLRRLPHMVDTVLLGSAIWLAWMLGQAPFVDNWLTAKVLALLAYILLGMRALGQNTPTVQRPAYFVAALTSVGYIVGVALTHSPTWGLI